MSHYFTNDNVESDIRKLETNILGKKFIFYSDNGVFSKNKLDFGTRLFLESIDIPSFTGNVLDVGCGYGPIGITVSKLTDCSVTMCDVNKRALHLSRMNIKENGITNIEVIESDCYKGLDDDVKFDYILTNPPIRAGKKVIYEIVMDARLHLKPSGTLFIVIRKEHGAKSMIKDLSKYYKTEVVNKSKGFFIIKCNLLLTN